MEISWLNGYILLVLPRKTPLRRDRRGVCSPCTLDSTVHIGLPVHQVTWGRNRHWVPVFQKSFRKRRTVGTTDLWSDNESSSQNMHLHIDYPDDFSRLWASGREEADSTRRQSQEKYWGLLQSSIYPLLFDRIWRCNDFLWLHVGPLDSWVWLYPVGLVFHSRVRYDDYKYIDDVDFDCHICRNVVSHLLRWSDDWGTLGF